MGVNHNRVSLIVIFNHKFEQNINLLRKIYDGRFSNIFFILPFYKGNDEDVISVYESSYSFQGYIYQKSKKPSFCLFYLAALGKQKGLSLYRGRHCCCGL